jgi:hypothetical protein
MASSVRSPIPDAALLAAVAILSLLLSACGSGRPSRPTAPAAPPEQSPGALRRATTATSTRSASPVRPPTTTAGGSSAPTAASAPATAVPESASTAAVAVGANLAWAPPPAALSVAERYVLTELSFRWNAGPAAWLGEVAPLCTSTWAAELRHSADGNSGGWAAVVANHEVAQATLLGAYPAVSPPGQHRIEIAGQVAITGSQPASRVSTVMVTLVPQGDQWLVASSS